MLMPTPDAASRDFDGNAPERVARAGVAIRRAQA